jgi:hypothetical protein
VRASLGGRAPRGRPQLQTAANCEDSQGPLKLYMIEKSCAQLTREPKKRRCTMPANPATASRLPTPTFEAPSRPLLLNARHTPHATALPRYDEVSTFHLSTPFILTRSAFKEFVLESRTQSEWELWAEDLSGTWDYGQSKCTSIRLLCIIHTVGIPIHYKSRGTYPQYLS